MTDRDDLNLAPVPDNVVDDDVGCFDQLPSASYSTAAHELETGGSEAANPFS